MPNPSGIMKHVYWLERSQKDGTIDLIVSASSEQRAENRTVLKKLLRCTYYLAKNRIAHTTNFAELVEHVIACGADDLQRFVHDEVRRNAKYTFTTATTDFITSIACWVEEELLQSLKGISILHCDGRRMH